MQSSTDGNVLLDSYHLVNKNMKFESRNGIISLLEELKGGKNRIIFLAPTGYGKSSIIYTLALAAFKGIDLYDRVIHVLPLRSIVDDLYTKMINSSKKIGIDPEEIGAKSMDFSRGSDFYTKRVTVTTMDTFISTLFKMNLEEQYNSANKRLTHYELGRSMIFSSIVVIDEFHIVTQDLDNEDYSQFLSSAMAMIESLYRISVPIILIGATLPNSIISYLREKFGFSLIEGNKSEITNVKDRNIEIKYCPEKEIGKCLNDILARKDKNFKLGVFVNTRKKAISLYKNLSRELNSVLLIHGKYSKEDYKKKLSRLKNEPDTYNLVISTQVLEAGVDISFDEMLTENAPLHVLVQRAGRLKRYGGKGVFTVCMQESEMPYENLKSEFLDESNMDEFKESIEEGMLKKFEEKEIVKKLDYEKLRKLREIDSNPFFTNRSSDKVLEDYCNFIRGVELLNGINENRETIPITGKEARRLINSGAKMIKRNNQVLDIEIGLLKRRDICLEPLFEKFEISGIKIKYDEETGVVFPWEEQDQYV